MDRHPLWLDALEHVLSRAGVTTVGRLTNPTEALALVETIRPTLLVLDPDVRDGELDGVECLRRACARVESLVALALSGSDEPQRIEAAFAAGAFGYVLKTTRTEDIAAAIRDVSEASLNGRAERRAGAAPGH